MNERKHKSLEDLNAFDGFMFNELMNQENREQAEDFCRTVLEPIVNRKIGKIEVISQRIIQGADNDHHGIQMDAYIREPGERLPKEDGEESMEEGFRKEDGEESPEVDIVLESAIYDIEPNDYKEQSEEKRTRYYHALIDNHILESGVKYDRLERVFVIFILKYDPFGLDRMMYTIKRRCVEEPDMPYDDGDTTIFLYVYGKKDIPSQKLQDMLLFLVDSKDENATDENLQRLSGMLKSMKANKRVGERYMHTYMREMHIRDEAMEEGIEKGEERLLVNLITAKIKQGCDVTMIAKDLVQTKEHIEELIEKHHIEVN